MNTKFTLTALVVLGLAFNLSATVYTSLQNGNYSSNATWVGNIAPPTTLPENDEIIINHDINLNQHIVVRGKMTINSGASLIGTKNLLVGDGGSFGELINHGIIEVKNLDVKGINTSGDINMPSLLNDGTITANKMDVGNDSGFGKVTNNSSGSITVSGELHLNNILSNAGSMTVDGTLYNHGGTLGGGGSITNCKIEFEANNSRPGTLDDQDICCNFASQDEPKYKIHGGGPLYSSLDAFVGANGLAGANHAIDGVEYFSCGVNSLGQTQLPVELVSFRVKENEQHHAALNWATEAEINNRFFIVERSVDGRNFDALGVVEGAGTTSEFQNYDFIDKLPLNFAYYRLKQVDFDGGFEYSPIVTLEMKGFKSSVIEAFPTMAEDEITIRFTSLDSRKSLLKIVNAYGKVMLDEAVYSTNQMEYRTLDLTGYEHGMYYILLSDGTQKHTSKFVVIKTY